MFIALLLTSSNLINVTTSLIKINKYISTSLININKYIYQSSQVVLYSKLFQMNYHLAVGRKNFGRRQYWRMFAHSLKSLVLLFCMRFTMNAENFMGGRQFYYYLSISLESDFTYVFHYQKFAICGIRNSIVNCYCFTCSCKCIVLWTKILVPSFSCFT